MSVSRARENWYDVLHLIENLLAPSAVKHLLTVVFSHTNHRKGFSWLGQEKIASAMGASRSTVQRAFQEAVYLGVLGIRRVRSGKGQKDQHNEFWIELDKIRQLTTPHREACSGPTTPHVDASPKSTTPQIRVDHASNRDRPGVTVKQEVINTACAGAPARAPQQKKQESQTTRRPQTARAAAAAVWAFKSFRNPNGVSIQPFGPVEFQAAWVSVYEKMCLEFRAHGNTKPSANFFETGMEETVQNCNAEGIKVPPLWFRLKRKIEKQELDFFFDHVDQRPAYPENLPDAKFAWLSVTTGEMKCYGDGVYAIRSTPKHPEGEPWPGRYRYGNDAGNLAGQPCKPCGDGCPDLEDGRCKPRDQLGFLSDEERKALLYKGFSSGWDIAQIKGMLWRKFHIDYKQVPQNRLSQIENVFGNANELLLAGALGDPRITSIQELSNRPGFADACEEIVRGAKVFASTLPIDKEYFVRELLKRFGTQPALGWNNGSPIRLDPCSRCGTVHKAAEAAEKCLRRFEGRQKAPRKSSHDSFVN